jgi:hypothetical protein
MNNSEGKKKFVNLFDFASRNNHKERGITQKEGIPQPPSRSLHASSSAALTESKSQWTYGFDTLLHFNDSLALSSINSHQSKNVSRMNRTNRYEEMINQAREDVQKLKSRRMQQEMDWKKVIPDKIEENVLVDESLAESEVTSYNLDSEIYPIQSSSRKAAYNDTFAVELRMDILKGKAEVFIHKLKSIFIANFLRELQVYSEMMDLYKKRNKYILKLIF